MSSSQPEPSPSSKNDFSDFFRQLSQKKTAASPTLPLMPKKTRFLTGVMLGGALGLFSGLITLILYWCIAPRSPIALYPLGPAGNALLGVILGVIIGGLCAAPDGALNGVILGCVTVATTLVLRNRLNPTPFFITSLTKDMNPTFVTVAGIILSLLQVALVAILCVPFGLLLRRAIEDQGELAYMPLWSWKRLRFPLAVLGFVGAFTAVFVLYPIY